MGISGMYSHTKHEFCGLDSFGVTGKCKVFMFCFGQTDGHWYYNIFQCGGIKNRDIASKYMLWINCICSRLDTATKILYDYRLTPNNAIIAQAVIFHQVTL